MGLRVQIQLELWINIKVFPSHIQWSINSLKEHILLSLCIWELVFLQVWMWILSLQVICNTWHSLICFRLLLTNASCWIFVCFSHLLFHCPWNYNNTCQGMWPISLSCPSLSLDGDVRQVHAYNIWRVYTLIWHIICCWKAFMSYIDSWSINYLVQMRVNCYQNPVFVAIYTLKKPNRSFFSLQICTKNRRNLD